MIRHLTVDQPEDAFSPPRCPSLGRGVPCRLYCVYWPNVSYMCFIGLSCQHPQQFFAGRPWCLWPCLVWGGIYELFLIIVAIIIIIIILQPVQEYFALESALRSLGFLMRSDEMTSSSILMQCMAKRRYVCLSIFVILVEDSHILFSLLFCAVCRIFWLYNIVYYHSIHSVVK